MTKIDTTAEKAFAEKLEAYKTEKISKVLNAIAKMEREVVDLEEKQKMQLKNKKAEVAEMIRTNKEGIEVIKKETFIPNTNPNYIAVDTGWSITGINGCGTF